MEATILYKSRAMQEVLHKLREVAPTSISILLYGETGTGKTLIARHIHGASAQRAGAFVMLDVGATPQNIVESMLFGHEKGAFTSASVQQIGLLEQANGGTLFLDEIQNLSLEVQTNYLHVVESGGLFRRLGGRQELCSRFRLIAATNANLRELVEKGDFRRDLYFRLDQFSVTIPSLRERKEDILPLAEHYLKVYSAKLGKTAHFTPAAHELLLHHSWLGNVRELINAIVKALVNCKNSELLPQDFDLDLRCETLLSKAKTQCWSLEELERRHIAAVLEETRNNLTHASRILHIDRSTLKRKMVQYKL